MCKVAIVGCVRLCSRRKRISIDGGCGSETTKADKPVVVGEGARVGLAYSDVAGRKSKESEFGVDLAL